MRLDTFVWGAILDSSHPDIGSATALPDSRYEANVLASTVSTVILTVGRGKGRLEWGKQHLVTVGNRIGKP